MQDSSIRFSFGASVPMVEVAATLRLATLAVETLHGEDRLRMEAKYDTDPATRTVVISTSSEVGRTLALVFGGYVRREFGDDAVKLIRSEGSGGRALAGAGA